MTFTRLLHLSLGSILSVGVASADITYTCAANIDTLGPANTCGVLNSAGSGA